VTTVRFLAALCVLIAGSSLAQHETQLREGGALAGLRFPGTGASGETSKVYIVQLGTPSAAEFFATTSRPAVKFAPGGGLRGPTFNPYAVGVQSHIQRVVGEQDAVLARIGPGPEKIYSYVYSLNGFAVRMTEAQAVRMANMPEVLHVWEDEVRPLVTNYSAEFLGLFDRDGGLRGEGLDGEGVVIGVIDSGISPGHPALRDTREADQPRACRSAWGESSFLGRWLCRSYRKAPDVLMFDPPEGWNGICEAGPRFTADDCNNKLIGARYFFDGAVASGPIDPDEIFSPRDVDGHGTHTATTASTPAFAAAMSAISSGAVTSRRELPTE